MSLSPSWPLSVSFAIAAGASAWALCRLAARLPADLPIVSRWRAQLVAAVSARMGSPAEDAASPERVAALAALSGALGALLGCMLLGFPLGLSWTALGMIIPALASSRSRARREAVERDLPFASDLLTLSVEGGLHVEQAFRRLAATLAEGPLRAEVSRLLAERSVGRGWAEALRAWGERSASGAVRDLASTLAQAEATGMSVAPALRRWSADLRARRIERAEARAHRAPVAMLFPILLCILPSVFLVLLGPPLARAFG